MRINVRERRRLVSTLETTPLRYSKNGNIFDSRDFASCLCRLAEMVGSSRTAAEIVITVSFAVSMCVCRLGAVQHRPMQSQS